MNNTTRALAAGLLLTMAATLSAQETTRSGGTATIRVSVVDGEVRVNTGTLALPASSATINWQLVNTPGWRFAAGSIDFGNANGSFSCRVVSEGAAYTCMRRPDAPRGQLAYRILLSNGAALVEPPQPNVYISLE